MFPGVGAGTGAAVSDGCRAWEGVGEAVEARGVGAEGCDRNARCACKVDVRRVVARPDRWRVGR